MPWGASPFGYGRAGCLCISAVGVHLAQAIVVSAFEFRLRHLACAVALLIMISGVAGVTACRRGVPVLDPGDKPPTMDGTISGRVMTENDTSRLVGRRVEVLNLATGDRRAVSTSNDGGFTIKVPPGKYRLQVELRPGESVIKGPDTIDINRGDIDNDVEIVVTVAPAKPHPADSIRDTDGLGAPIA